MAKILDIEGIGPKYARKLSKLSIQTTEGLLKQGASKRGRQNIAEQSDIPEKLVLEWVNLADLMRIKGVGEEYSDLLEEAGVDTVKELRNRRAENLHEKIIEVNSKKLLVRRVPSLSSVKTWIAEAKKLKPIITH
jgi:predicted flap endonuclease-1-like 5' DNA nuclease